MTFGTSPFGVVPFGALPTTQAPAVEETGVVTIVQVLSVEADAQVEHAWSASETLRLGLRADAFVLGGEDSTASSRPTAWVEDTETSTTWSTDSATEVVPSNLNSEE